jgi:hypothetical protein
MKLNQAQEQSPARNSRERLWQGVGKVLLALSGTILWGLACLLLRVDLLSVEGLRLALFAYPAGFVLRWYGNYRSRS